MPPVSFTNSAPISLGYMREIMQLGIMDAIELARTLAHARAAVERITEAG